MQQNYFIVMNVFLTVSLQQPTDYFGDLFYRCRRSWRHMDNENFIIKEQV